ncbi:ribosome silencing factor [Bacteriovoracaceae bacterium]|nr:ribosome silencing factor [Bacteriovoracaceae bacterium]|tara:strand:+ start:50975 stop:51442 length:468 start_codon:yes stop_codon:yes gene_type:complete
MSKAYINAQVDEIVKNKEFEFPKNLAMATAWILGNLKGINLKVFDVSGTSSLSDYYVVASAGNPTQANAMADTVTEELKRNGSKIISKEGLKHSDWILIDSGDLIVHIFLDTAREVYGVEELWREGKPISIPQDYYFSEPENSESEDTDTDRDFF